MSFFFAFYFFLVSISIRFLDQKKVIEIYLYHKPQAHLEWFLEFLRYGPHGPFPKATTGSENLNIL